jgi:hypothetical protein
MSICSTGLPAAPTRRWGALNLNSKPELPPPGAYPARAMPALPRHWRDTELFKDHAGAGLL